MRSTRTAILVATALLVTVLASCQSVPGSPQAGSGPAAAQSAAPPSAPVPAGADAGPPLPGVELLPPERRTTWNPGLNPIGGIPNRTTVYQTLTPSGGDDTGAIQAALNSAPPDQVVKLGAGSFQISDKGLELTRSGVTLRGEGPGKTKLAKAKGTNYPVVSIGTRFFKGTQPVDLASDAARGATSVVLGANPGLGVGEIVTLDQLTDPELTVWGRRSPPGDPSRGWFGRLDRPIGQVMEVKAVAGNTVSFTTPLHTAFTTAHSAQIVRLSDSADGPVVPAVRLSGVEDLYVSGGEGGDGGGNIHLFATAYSWVRGVESDASDGGSAVLDGAFRSVVRDSYLHSTVNPSPGGAGYGIVLNAYAADNLVENNISWNFNKVIAMRTTGGGNVIGYNYMEDGWGKDYPTIPEVGLNAAHMTTPHYELFEGNQAWNFDSDSVWGNSIYVTAFRNHLTGQRRSVSPLQLTDAQNRRAIGLTVGHWWYSFVGNVLGTANQSPAPATSFVYDTPGPAAQDTVPMWQLGYDGEDPKQPFDPKVGSTALRHGNFDYVTNKIAWDPALPPRLPASLYLPARPAFFGDQPWPWVTPEGGAAQLAVLPARQRFDSAR